jgi:hypothetical protein
MVLGNLPPVPALVVRWQWPLFERAETLDPTKLKQAGGRPPKHTPEMLLKCLGSNRFRTVEWQEVAEKEHGIKFNRVIMAAQLFTHLGSIWPQSKPEREFGSSNGTLRVWPDLLSRTNLLRRCVKDWSAAAGRLDCR